MPDGASAVAERRDRRGAEQRRAGRVLPAPLRRQPPPAARAQRRRRFELFPGFDDAEPPVAPKPRRERQARAPAAPSRARWRRSRRRRTPSAPGHRRLHGRRARLGPRRGLSRERQRRRDRREQRLVRPGAQRQLRLAGELPELLDRAEARRDPGHDRRQRPADDAGRRPARRHSAPTAGGPPMPRASPRLPMR